MTYNPRYLAYCRAMGEPEPERMRALDKERWPAGHMAGFMLWMSERWQEWHAARGLRRHAHVLSDDDHASFHRELQERWP